MIASIKEIDMLKLILIMTLFVVSSCSPVPSDNTTIGKIRRFEPLAVTVEDTERMKRICLALSAKEDLLSTLVLSGEKYDFTYSEKGCLDKTISSSKMITTKIVKNEGNYIFKASDNETYFFSDVETTSKGVMSEICKNLSGLTSPVQTSSSQALWFTSFISGQDCQADENTICIHLQSGSVMEDGLSYRIHTNQWLKFKVTNGRLGFFTERKLITSLTCSGIETLEKRVGLNETL
jgi:hypothetical protein